MAPQLNIKATEWMLAVDQFHTADGIIPFGGSCCDTPNTSSTTAQQMSPFFHWLLAVCRLGLISENDFGEDGKEEE